MPAPIDDHDKASNVALSSNPTLAAPTTIDWEALDWKIVDFSYKPIMPRDFGYPFDTWEAYNAVHKKEDDCCPHCGRDY